jgi:hypothetical protein
MQLAMTWDWSLCVALKIADAATQLAMTCDWPLMYSRCVEVSAFSCSKVDAQIEYQGLENSSAVFATAA